MSLTSSNRVMFSDYQLNPPCNPPTLGRNGIINFGNGAQQTLLLSDIYNTSGNLATLLISFKDVMVTTPSSGDRDYNDFVFQATVSPGYSINVNQTCSLPLSNSLSTTCVIFDITGIYVTLSSNNKSQMINNPANYFVLCFKQTLSNSTLAGNLYNILNNCTFTYPVIVSRVNLTVGFMCQIPYAEICWNIYVLNIMDNMSQTSTLGNYLNIIDYQNIITTISNVSSSSLIIYTAASSSTVNNPVAGTYLFSSTCVSAGVMFTSLAQGDPMITTFSGQQYMLGLNDGFYQLYADDDLIINTELDKYPGNANLPIYKSYIFMHYIMISYKGQNIIFDMFNNGVSYTVLPSGTLLRQPIPYWIQFIYPSTYANFPIITNVSPNIRYYGMFTKLLGFVIFQLSFTYNDPNVITSFQILSVNIVSTALNATGAFISNDSSNELSSLTDNI